MRPQRIELYGFTAFRELQTVELEDFHLFVITGPTGAGKTSLLDAMIFALYGRVPRAGSHSVRELVTHGMAEARVLLEFSLDGQRYRISRRLPRNGSQSATLERQEGEQWRPEVEGGGVTAVNTHVVGLLKLPYDAFTKAVVLPQGEFHRFLKGEPAERRRILTDLLGLKHYLAMGQRARARADELKTRIASTEEILEQQFGDVSEDAVTALEEAVAEAKSRAEELATKLEAATDLENERERLSGNSETLGKLRGDLSELREQLLEAQDRAARQEEQETELSQKHKEAEKAVAACLAAVGEAEDKRRATLERCGDLEALARVEAALEALERCETQLTEEEEALAGVTEEASELRASLKEAIKQARKLGGELEKAATKAQRAQDAKDEAAKIAEGLAQRLARIDEEIEKETQVRKQLEKAERRLAKAESAATPAAERAAKAERDVARLRHDHAAVLLASEAKTGDPCPVCQRPLEEHPAPQPDVTEKLEAAEAQLAELREKHEAARAEFVAAGEGRAACERELKQASATIKQLLGDYAAREQLLAAADAARLAANQAVAAAEEVGETSEAARKAEGEARNEVASLQATLKGLEERSALLRRRITGLASEKKKAVTVAQKHFGTPIPDAARKRLDEQRSEVTAAQEELGDRRDELEGAREALATAQSELQGIQRQLAQLDTDLAVLRTEAEQSRQELGQLVSGLEGLAAPGSLPRRVKSRRKGADHLIKWGDRAKKVIDRAEERLRELIQRCEKGLLTLAREAEGEIEEAALVCARLREVEAEARAQHGERKAEAQSMKRGLKQRDELRAKIAKHAAEAVVLNALAAELRADRFVAFIQQETLDLLSARASDELQRISDKRYSLVSEAGNFAVIDHINADERRSVDTLSGGETFLASLSLALALSQHVGDLAAEGMGAKLEAVFIDEGFGALDDETLEEVIDALERLREGELMVGVITHVPALAQRIREGLRVETAGGKATVRLAEAE